MKGKDEVQKWQFEIDCVEKLNLNLRLTRNVSEATPEREK